MNTTKTHAKAQRPSFFGMADTVSAEQAEQNRSKATIKGKSLVANFTQAANDGAVPLMKRGAFQCAWPVGHLSKRDQMCCGARIDMTATKSTASYCAEHRKKASAGLPPRISAALPRHEAPSRRFNTSVWDGGRAA